MVRKKAAASSVALAVFRDEPQAPSPRGDNGENASHHLPPPRKKTRLDTESPIVATAPRTRRAALKEKATNPSSSDNSFLRSIDKHELFHEKLQKSKRKALTDSDTTKATDLGIIKNKSPLQEASVSASQVHQTLKKQLSAKDLDELLSFMEENAAQDAANFVAKKGCWFPELLDCFRTSDLKLLDLSSPSSPSGIFIPHVPPSLTLQVLFQQNKFTTLTVVSFRNTPLLNDDVALLRLLPSLADLDISNTGVGTQALHHLVCHRHTLTKLNLSHNPSIDDDSRVVLSALPKLIALYLRGTSFTMPGLRRLVSNDIGQSCRLLSIPAHCIDHLNTRQQRYLVDIPTGYMEDPSKVPEMTMPNLKKNLELHAKVNRDIQVTGTKVELVNRLGVILSNRIADLKIVKVLGRA